MDGQDDTDAEAMDRLERALGRIEAAKPRPAVPPELTARLDAVIARLRAGLEE